MWLQALTTREPDESMIEVAIASVEAVFDWQTFIEKDGKKKSGKKNKGNKKQEAPVTEEVAATKEAPAEKAPVQEGPLEIDIAQLFDIKLSGTSEAPKKGKAPKKDPMPSATKAVAASVSKDEDDDDILKALDMYFEYKGSKSVMEISDEETDEDTNA